MEEMKEVKEGRGSEEVVRARRGGKGWCLFYTRDITRKMVASWSGVEGRYPSF